MADPSTHINYTFEDIQRYLQGKMSSAEMHDIEKASLQDSFLADAIEGYTDVSAATAKQHLNEINASLFIEKQKPKVVAFHNRMRWMNIAAILILIAGVSVLSVYLLKNSNKQQEIAQVKNQPAKKEVLKDSIASDNINSLTKKPDTSLLIADNKNVKKSAPLVKKSVVKKDVETDKGLEENNADIASMAVAPVQMSRSNESSIMDTVFYNMKTEKTMNVDAALQGKVSGVSVLPNTFSGKVVDENNKPIPYATIESADKKTAVVTDLNGNFSIQKNDTILNVTASTIGYNSNASNLEAGYANVIKLKGASTALNDVVITTAMGVNKKAKINSDSAMPIGGWENFNNYVLSKLNKDSASKNFIPYNDLVEIEFLIDKAGNPYNFKIVRPLDEQRDAKAIEILKSGPKWTNTSKKKKARVTISF